MGTLPCSDFSLGGQPLPINRIDTDDFICCAPQIPGDAEGKLQRQIWKIQLQLNIFRVSVRKQKLTIRSRRLPTVSGANNKRRPLAPIVMLKSLGLP